MSHYRKQFLYLLGLALFLVPATGLRGADADLILKNGRIWTGDAENPWAEAVAIRGARILAVGNNQPIAESAGPHARVIDLSGRLAIPGFNDAQMHFLEGSLLLPQLNLSGDCGLSAMQAHLRTWAAAHPREPWITGYGWRDDCLPGQQLPAKGDLDAVVRDRPVFLRSFDGQTAWVNSKALQMAGVTARVGHNEPGQVITDRNTGEPTGCLRGGARKLVERMIPESSREKKLAAVEQGLQLASSLGITSIQTAGGDIAALSLFEEVERQRKLTARLNVALTVSPAATDGGIDDLLALKQSYRGLRLRAGAARFVLDGSMESHTAAMLAPYADAKNTSGRLFWQPERYSAMVALCDSAGFQVITRAAGDRAVRVALDAYESARKANGWRDARDRISAIEAIAPADISRFARLRVIALMQPSRAGAGAMNDLERAAGPERMEFLFPWRALRLAGAGLVFSSGWPSSISPDPLRAIYLAVSGPAGRRISVESAVRAYTENGAHASFEERVKGKLKAGMLADIAVLSDDIFRVSPEEIDRTKVDLTIFDGQVVYRRK